MKLFKRIAQLIVGQPVENDYRQRLAALEERWQSIEAEWTDWYEKFRLLHLRLAHRQKALEKAERALPQAEEQSNGAETANAAPLPDLHPGLTDAQRELQQKILRQRARF